MNQIRDGDLYRTVVIDGVEFRILYGYISEGERERGWAPYPVYPDFLREPRYTEGGWAFATAFQDVCSHYAPTASGEVWCGNCLYFDKRDKCIGICTHSARRKDAEE